VNICNDGGVSETADAAAAAAQSHNHLPSSSSTHTARNVIALLQSLHDAMPATPVCSTASVHFISSFLFDCISRIKWSSSLPPDAAASPMMLSNPVICAVIAAAQPLLQVSLRFFSHHHYPYSMPLRFLSNILLQMIRPCLQLPGVLARIKGLLFLPQPYKWHSGLRHPTEFSRNYRHDDDGAGRSSRRCLASGNQQWRLQ
jgi:hypothetical protein